VASGEPFDAPIVDSHAHIFTRDMPLAANAWTRPDYGFTAEDYLAVLDAHGVHFGVIAAVSLYGTYNDYLIRSLRRHPRLRGTVNLDPRSADLHTFERLRADGVVGVRLQLARRKELPDLTDDAHRAMFRRIADLGWHVHVAVEAHWVPLLLPQLEAAGVNVVFDHFGHPDPDRGVACESFEALLRSVDKGRTWIKLSAAYRLTWRSDGGTTPDPRAMELGRNAAKRLLEVAGAERLLWGSDCPFVGHEKAVTYRDTLASFESWVPSPRHRRRISDTALKLYFS
jgi:predicted TIM-barrel fold metal-dependent hydrolase